MTSLDENGEQKRALYVFYINLGSVLKFFCCTRGLLHLIYLKVVSCVLLNVVRFFSFRTEVKNYSCMLSLRCTCFWPLKPLDFEKLIFSSLNVSL